MGTLIVDKVPDEIKKRFKIHCMEKDIPMRDYIIFLMKEIPKGDFLRCPVKKGKV